MLNMFDISVAVKAQVKYLVDNLMGVEFQEIRRGDRPLLSYVLSKLRTETGRRVCRSGSGAGAVGGGGISCSETWSPPCMRQ